MSGTVRADAVSSENGKRVAAARLRLDDIKKTTNFIKLTRQDRINVF